MYNEEKSPDISWEGAVRAGQQDQPESITICYSDSIMNLMSEISADLNEIDNKTRQLSGSNDEKNMVEDERKESPPRNYSEDVMRRLQLIKEKTYHIRSDIGRFL